jgi:transposase InsO family protein
VAIGSRESARQAASVRFEDAQPNDLWQMAFKRAFAIPKRRCHTFTLLDNYSRYNLVLAACANRAAETVREQLVAAFRRYGLPLRIAMDDDAPWGSDDRDDFTPLTVWLMRLGIAISHSRTYHPQTRGKLARFYRTVTEETISGWRFQDLTHVQQAYDDWRRVYNDERPHEAIDLKRPRDRYRPSARSYPEQLPAPEYSPEETVRTVQDGGFISFHDTQWRLPKALQAQAVALRATASDGVYDVCFGRQLVAKIDLRTRVVLRAAL